MRTDAGHRKRTKDRFRKEGLDNFDEVHALELLLFYAIPRKDTKPIARRLLDRFGSFAKVVEATEEALMQVEGVGQGTATYLKLMRSLVRYYSVNQDENSIVFNSIEDYGKYLINFFRGKREESAWVMCMDGKCKLLCTRKISEGGQDSVNVSIRSVVEVALSVNATTILLAHNHPNGLALPSTADLQVTEKIAKGLDAVGICLFDHVIVSENDYISLRHTHVM